VKNPPATIAVAAALAVVPTSATAAPGASQASAFRGTAAGRGAEAFCLVRGSNRGRVGIDVSVRYADVAASARARCGPGQRCRSKAPRRWRFPRCGPRPPSSAERCGEQRGPWQAPLRQGCLVARAHPRARGAAVGASVDPVASAGNVLQRMPPRRHAVQLVRLALPNSAPCMFAPARWRRLRTSRTRSSNPPSSRARTSQGPTCRKRRSSTRPATRARDGRRLPVPRVNRGGHPPLASTRARSRISRPRSISSGAIVRGGAMRRMLPSPANLMTLTLSPSSRQRAVTADP
jgi:hypothetical protein